MKVAIAQIDTRPADLEGTASRVADLSHRAVREGAQLLVLPHTAMTGQHGADGSFVGPAFALDLAWQLTGLAGQVACPTLVPVVLDFGEEGGSAMVDLLLDGGKATPITLLALGDGDEDAGQDPADLPVVQIGDLRWGVANSLDDLADYADYDYDVDAVLFLPDLPFQANDPDTALGATLASDTFAHDAADMGAWIVAAASLGTYDVDTFCGGSFVLDAQGQVAALAPAFEEAFLVTDVLGKGKACPQPLEPEVYDEPLFVWQALALGVRDALARQGLTKAALVLDDTLASHVLATLATDALGPTNVRVLVDGEAGGSEASRLAAALRAPVRTASVGAAPEGLVGNAARVWRRGCLQAELAAWALQEGAGVLDPIDKTGLVLGEARPAAALRPLGDVYRSDLLRLARMRNTMSPLLPRPHLAPSELVELPGVPQGSRSDEAWVAAVDKVLRARLERLTLPEEVAAAVGEDQAFVTAVLTALDAGCERMADGGVLALSSTIVADVQRTQGLAWSDADHDAAWAQQAQERVESLVRTYGPELARWQQVMAASAGKGQDGQEAGQEGLAIDSEDLRQAVQDGMRELRETLGYLGDFSVREVAPGQEGRDHRAGSSHEWTSTDGDQDEPRWHFPFSEN